MKSYVIWVVLGLPAVALLSLGMPFKSLAGNDIKREWREGMREIRSERREAAREILNADTPGEFRREIREGIRQVRRERREMRREIRREMRDRYR